jgi:hypothetical protein
MLVTVQCETGLLILPREVETQGCEFFLTGWKRTTVINASLFAAVSLVHHKPRDLADRFSSS